MSDIDEAGEVLSGSTPLEVGAKKGGSYKQRDDRGLRPARGVDVVGELSGSRSVKIKPSLFQRVVALMIFVSALGCTAWAIFGLKDIVSALVVLSGGTFLAYKLGLARED